MTTENTITESVTQSFDSVIEALKTKGDPLSIAAMKLLVQMDEEREENQSRLDLLDALERGGVSSWEWYDQSIADYLENGE